MPASAVTWSARDRSDAGEGWGRRRTRPVGGSSGTAAAIRGEARSGVSVKRRSRPAAVWGATTRRFPDRPRRAGTCSSSARIGRGGPGCVADRCCHNDERAHAVLSRAPGGASRPGSPQMRHLAVRRCAVDRSQTRGCLTARTCRDRAARTAPAPSLNQRAPSREAGSALPRRARRRLLPPVGTPWSHHAPPPGAVTKGARSAALPGPERRTEVAADGSGPHTVATCRSQAPQLDESTS